MRSLVLSLALAGLSAGAAHAQSPTPAAAFAHEAFADADLIPLSMFDFEPADRDLWSGLDMLEADLLDRSGTVIGDVEDILVTLDGYAVALVVELDGFLEFDETVLTIPFSLLEPMPEANAVRAPIAVDGLEMYSIFDRRMLTAAAVSDRVVSVAENDLDAALTGSNVFLLEDTLLGEYAPLDDDALGYVHDVLFSMAGLLEAVVVSAARGPAGGVAVPFTGATDAEPSLLESTPFTAEELGIRE